MKFAFICKKCDLKRKLGKPPAKVGALGDDIIHCKHVIVLIDGQISKPHDPLNFCQCEDCEDKMYEDKLNET